MTKERFDVGVVTTLVRVDVQGSTELYSSHKQLMETATAFDWWRDHQGVVANPTRRQVRSCTSGRSRSF